MRQKIVVGTYDLGWERVQVVLGVKKWHKGNGKKK